ncbi:hypothetical protein FAGAP_6250 [Fusarium agapanthi]|uniref:Uncharacterized protein n=1 Tax=Fusarium agapanthi TaxID=1803897 RepID=A0A9P5EE38_9HYPO|nr:hypothetical protein FAGAP_6250 [Fusarium agapanthi]
MRSKAFPNRARALVEVGSLKIAPGYEDELNAALFMFMCCNIDTSPGKRYNRYPAWAARVAMRKSESGRAWLRERYLFAIGKSKDCGRNGWDERDFDPWLKEVGELWDYERNLQRLGMLLHDLGNDTEENVFWS